VSVAVVSLVSFLIGALLPVAPWIVASGDGLGVVSISIGVITAAIAGAVIGKQSERPLLIGALRQVGILLVAVAVTYAIGSLVGVNIA